MDEKTRVTLADVAAAAGVSKMTASRALRGARDVSKSNIENVRRAAKEIGYVGNHLASSLSGQRSDLIGVVVPSTANTVFSEVLAGIAEGIEGSGMQPVFGVTDYDLEKEYDIIRSMLSWNPTGLIVTGLDQSIDARRLLENADIPVVQIMDVDGTPVDACFGLSHYAAGRAMGDALIGMGCRHFGYIGCDLKRDTRAQKRLDGFKTALAKHNLDLLVEEICDSPSATKPGRELTAQVLAQFPALDCIYYSNDDVAAGGAFHCIANGISVPGTITLAGFNGLDLVASLPVRLVSSQTPRKKIGQSAVEHIISVNRTKEKSETRIVEYTPSIIGRA